MDLLLAQAPAPQGKSQHLRGQIPELVRHTLADDLQFADIGLEVSAGTEGGVVVDTLDSDQIALLVHPVHKISLVPVHVQAETVQNLQVGNGAV